MLRSMRLIEAKTSLSVSEIVEGPHPVKEASAEQLMAIPGWCLRVSASPVQHYTNLITLYTKML